MLEDELKILLIEDNPGDARLVRELMRDASDLGVSFQEVASLEASRKALENGTFDVVLLDLGLPDSQGLNAFFDLKRLNPEMPIIVLSGFRNKTVAMEAVREGAQDYLEKGTISGLLLDRSIRYAMERQRMQNDLQRMALLDPLTELFNRRGFIMLADRNMDLARRQEKILTLAYFDIDNMKEINDRLGHGEGDRFLRAFAMLLRKTFRSTDILTRLGGDEFAVLCFDSKDSPAGRERWIITRLEENMAAADFPNNSKLSVSCGTAQYDPQDPCTLEELLRTADSRMYEQKRIKQTCGSR